jgi:peptidoglycan-associated lipoprotein
MRQVLVTATCALFLASAAFGQSAGQVTAYDQSASAPNYAPATPAQQQELQQNLKDIHFAFDRFDLSPEDRSTLEQNANWLKANPEVFVTIAGEADERGSIVYNLYLSQERAETTRNTLVELGVPADHIVFATGWGKLYPVCEQSDESCWAQNRRAHFEPWQLGSFAAKNTSAQSTIASVAKK